MNAELLWKQLKNYELILNKCPFLNSSVKLIAKIILNNHKNCKIYIKCYTFMRILVL